MKIHDFESKLKVPVTVFLKRLPVHNFVVNGWIATKLCTDFYSIKKACCAHK